MYTKDCRDCKCNKCSNTYCSTKHCEVCTMVELTPCEKCELFQEEEEE